MDTVAHIESWTVDEVLEFLTRVNLDDYSNDFLENEITGDILVHLDHEALKDIGVESVGHRLTILRAVYDKKIADDVPIEPDHFVPASAEVDATSTAGWSAKDLSAITDALQQRDDRMLVAETEIRRLTESLSRLKEQLIPVFKIVKEFQPLPTPDGTHTKEATLSRKFSTKKLFLGSAPRQASPTTIPSAEYYTEPVSPSSPYKYGDSSSRSQTPNHQNLLPTLTESQPARLPAPPRPPPPGTLSSRGRDRSDDGSTTPSTTSSTTTLFSSASAASNASIDAFKSFRVGFDDPCSKVLPAALKKYKINSDWRDYSLFICYGETERSLGLDEKPLLVFQELQRLHKNPVFMLRLRKEVDDKF